MLCSGPHNSPGAEPGHTHLLTPSLGCSLLQHTFYFSPWDTSRGHLTSIFLFYYTTPKKHYERFHFSPSASCPTQGTGWTDSWLWCHCRPRLSAGQRSSCTIPRNENTDILPHILAVVITRWRRRKGVLRWKQARSRESKRVEGHSQAPRGAFLPVSGEATSCH